VGITEATVLRLRGTSEDPRSGHPNTNICIASRLDSESTQGAPKICAYTRESAADGWGAAQIAFGVPDITLTCISLLEATGDLMPSRIAEDGGDRGSD
jgi:hypothetical protein